jgi:hypothetical protein
MQSFGPHTKATLAGTPGQKRSSRTHVAESLRDSPSASRRDAATRTPSDPAPKRGLMTAGNEKAAGIESPAPNAIPSGTRTPAAERCSAVRCLSAASATSNDDGPNSRPPDSSTSRHLDLSKSSNSGATTSVQSTCRDHSASCVNSSPAERTGNTLQPGNRNASRSSTITSTSIPATAAKSAARPDIIASPSRRIDALGGVDCRNIPPLVTNSYSRIRCIGCCPLSVDGSHPREKCN